MDRARRVGDAIATAPSATASTTAADTARAAAVVPLTAADGDVISRRLACHTDVLVLNGWGSSAGDTTEPAPSDVRRTGDPNAIAGRPTAPLAPAAAAAAASWLASCAVAWVSTECARRR